MSQPPEPPQQPPPPQPQAPPPPGMAPQTNGLAVAGMVCGILGLVLFWTVWGGIILGILGLVFGIIGRGRATALGGSGAGMAMAGIITGAIAIVLSIAWIFIFAAIFFTRGDELRDAFEQLEQLEGALALR